ncbi:MAG: hypothetical protein KY412_04570, partial [Actinobacteria bacterium]|nr:hypothetical protein [Actinomycetota bacterium]
MDDATRAFENVVWAAAEGTATDEDRAVLEADPAAWRRTLERLLHDTDEHLDAVRHLRGPERDQVVADFEAELGRLEAAYELLTRASDPTAVVLEGQPAGEVRLQASWSSGQVVVWAGGPEAPPASNDDLADRLQAIGGPALGWSQHRAVPLPSGARAAALSIPVEEALGWLVAVGGGLGREGVGTSVTWLGQVAVRAVRLVARGSAVPTLRGAKRQASKTMDLAVQWVPALVDETELKTLATAMPGPVSALDGADARSVTLDVLGAVVHAVIKNAAGRIELPAPPPTTRTSSAVAEAVVTRLDGSSFEAPVAAGAEVSKRLDRWARPVIKPIGTRLVVQLDPPDSGDAWFLSVLGPGAEGGFLPIEVALGDSAATKPLADELARLERLLPALHRPGGLRRGQVYLSQAEAWELMTVTGA